MIVRFGKIIIFMEQVRLLFEQLQRDIAVDTHVLKKSEPDVIKEDAPASEPEEIEPTFDEAGQKIHCDGKTLTFSRRKARRFQFLKFLASRLGEFVSADEIAEVFYDMNNWCWATIRRYGVRVQEDELRDFPFHLRVEKEGFTLLPLD